MLGNYSLAKAVADQVLMQCPTFTDALLVKGEAFYNCCEFEHALLIFYRGARLSSDTEGFENGIKKCIKTLQNIVGPPDMFSFNGIAMFVKKVQHKTKQDPKFLDNYLAGKDKFPPLSSLGSTTRWTAAADGQLATKQGGVGCGGKTGKKETNLNEDKRYLQNLAKMMDGEKQNKSIAGKISLQANQALDFINGRSSFWDQIEN